MGESSFGDCQPSVPDGSGHSKRRHYAQKPKSRAYRERRKARAKRLIGKENIFESGGAGRGCGLIKSLHMIRGAYFWWGTGALPACGFRGGGDPSLRRKNGCARMTLSIWRAGSPGGPRAARLLHAENSQGLVAGGERSVHHRVRKKNVCCSCATG